MTIYTTGHMAQRAPTLTGDEIEPGSAYVLLGMANGRERFVGIASANDDGIKHFTTLCGQVFRPTFEHHFLPVTLRVNVER